MKNRAKHLPLTHALAWIVGSVMFITGPAYACFKHYLKRQNRFAQDTRYAIRSLIQTGPQKEALKTDYLAELIGLSADAPPHSLHFDLQRAKEKLLQFPLIAHADVKLMGPDTLYVDYTIRQPIAYLEDFENLAIDKEGYPLPFSPFFSPKNLPSFYFGTAKFGAEPIDPEKPKVDWGIPLQGKYFEIALHILSIVTEPQVADLFNVKRIDVSNAFAESYGTREIVLITEDTLIHTSEGKMLQLFIPRILRLSTKNYAQELGNYLQLRPQLLEEERKGLHLLEKEPSPYYMKEKVIDFRIQKLAFVEEVKSSA